MLSEHFPAWIAGALSPLAALLMRKFTITSDLKPWFMLMLAGALSAAGISFHMTMAETPVLGWGDLMPQAMALLALGATGYTMAKPVDRLRAAPTAALIVGCLAGIVGLGVWAVAVGAQPAAVPETLIVHVPVPADGMPIPEVPPAGPVQSIAALGVQMLIAALGGIFGRLVRKIPV